MSVAFALNAIGVGIGPVAFVTGLVGVILMLVGVVLNAIGVGISPVAFVASPVGVNAGLIGLNIKLFAYKPMPFVFTALQPLIKVLLGSYKTIPLSV